MKNGLYELIIAPSDYPGKRYRGRYCYEHHLVYWRETGILPKESECIHHLNGNKRDNRRENLVLMEKAAHSSEHAKPIPMAKLVCDFCGIEFERSLRDIKAKRKAGYNNSYCNRSCMGKMQAYTNLHSRVAQR